MNNLIDVVKQKHQHLVGQTVKLADFQETFFEVGNLICLYSEGSAFQVQSMKEMKDCMDEDNVFLELKPFDDDATLNNEEKDVVYFPMIRRGSERDIEFYFETINEAHS